MRVNKYVLHRIKCLIRWQPGNALVESEPHEWPLNEGITIHIQICATHTNSDLICDIFRRFMVSHSGRRCSNVSNGECIKKFYVKKCGYLAAEISRGNRDTDKAVFPSTQTS